jgi:hypothetical protein
MMTVVLLLLSAGQATSIGAEAPPPRLLTGRPRLLLRAEAWADGPSVAELRERVGRSPFKERAHLLRTTIANLSLKWLIYRDEKAAAQALERMRKWNRAVRDSYDGIALIDLALGYDWLHGWPGFTDADKRAVAEKMVKLARELRAHLEAETAHVFHTRMYAWDSGIGVAGLALHDTHPQGAALFDFARDYYEKRLLPARQLQGGAFHNGFMYGMNAMMFPLLQFLKAAKSAAGIDYFHTEDPAGSAWLREVPYFLIYGTRPDLKTVRYADLTSNRPRKHFRFGLDILAAEYSNGYAADLAHRLSEHYNTSGYHAEWIYLYLLFHDPTVERRPFDSLPTFRVFSRGGLGHVFFRSDWSDASTVVHFICGDYFGDHGHFDQGRFTLFRRTPLSLKTGFYDFGSEHRLHWFKQAISANTLIFSDPQDGTDEGRQRNVRFQEAHTVEEYRKHLDRGLRLNLGDLVAVDESDRLTIRGKAGHFVSANVTPAWDAADVKRHVRHVAFVNGNHLLVIDEAETTRPDIRCRWLLHTPSRPIRAGKAWMVRQPDAVLAVQALLPAQPKVTLIGGAGRECEVNGVNYTYLEAGKFKRYNRSVEAPVPELGIWRMEIEPRQEGTRRLFVTVLTAGDPDLAPPAARAVRNRERLTVDVGDTEIRLRLAPGT